jgi:hypothetical protein
MRPSAVLEKVPLREWVSIPCDRQLTEQSGTVDFIAAAHTLRDPQIVAFICNGLQFGPGVPVTYIQKGDGYSFSGSVPFCYGPFDPCSNGEYKTMQTFVSGTIDTSEEPDALKFTYRVNLYCGGVLSCVEEGTYDGTKGTYGTPSYKGDPLDASYVGKSSWNLKCCPKGPPPPPRGGMETQP